MKKLLLIVGLVVGLCSVASAAWSPTFVSYTTFTAPGSGFYPWAFANKSTGYKVEVNKIDVGSCNDGSAITSGLMNFDLFMASSLTDGVTNTVSTYSYTLGKAFPSNVQASTSPTNIVLEHKVNQLPILPPFVVNPDETATTNFFASWSLDSENTQPIILPRSGTRALVLRQRTATTDYTAGCVFARVEFKIKRR